MHAGTEGTVHARNGGIAHAGREGIAHARSEGIAHVGSEGMQRVRALRVQAFVLLGAPQLFFRALLFEAAGATCP